MCRGLSQLGLVPILRDRFGGRGGSRKYYARSQGGRGGSRAVPRGTELSVRRSASSTQNTASPPPRRAARCVPCRAASGRLVGVFPSAARLAR